METRTICLILIELKTIKLHRTRDSNIDKNCPLGSLKE